MDKLEKQARECSEAIIESAFDYLKAQGYETKSHDSISVLLSALTQVTVRTAATSLPPEVFLQGFLRCVSQHYEGVTTRAVTKEETDSILGTKITGPTIEC